MFRRPKIITLLALFFTYSLYRDIGMFFNLTTSSDYNLFKEVGLEYLFFIMFAIIILSNLYVVLNYWRPKPLGFWIAVISLITNIIETIGAGIIAFNHPNLVKELYIISRKARGLALREEDMAQFFTPDGIILTVSLAVAIPILGLVLVILKRNWFLKNSDS